MASVTLENVRKQFGNVEALRDIGFTVENGEFVVLVGPSGCGKTTLLRIIAGLEEASSGTIRFDDRVVNDVAPSKRGAAMVFQSYALYPHKTVAENMGFALKMSRTPKAKINSLVKDTARVLQLENLLDRKPRELSGGQRQRVAIGRAIVRHPGVFLFDEPLSNLDAALRVDMRLELARLHHTLGTTMIYVTHDQIEAMTLATKIVVMRNGNIEQIGSPQELYESPANKFVAGFLGMPQMNFMNAVARNDSSTGHKPEINLFGDGKTLVSVPSETSVQAFSGAGVVVGVRPEHISLGPAETGSVAFDAVTTHAEYLGSVQTVYLEAGSGPDTERLVALAPPGTAIEIGARRKINFRPEHCHYFDESGAAMTTRAA